MLKNGVIMDVTNAAEARIAEEAGACAVMALERIPSEIRKNGGVARMSDPAMIKEIIDAVSIPVMAKCRIGHMVEAQILQAVGVDFIDESEVLSPADPSLRRGILAYLSDYALLSASLIPHGVNMFDRSMQTASLDHAMWFHEDVPLDDWLLYSSESPWSGHGRGIGRGVFHSRDGRAIAHVTQEGLIRLRPDLAPRTTIPHMP